MNRPPDKERDDREVRLTSVQEEIDTLQAEIRSATQHRDAAYARMQETQRELENLLERARALLSRPPPEDGPGSGPARTPAEDD